jgi:long-chain acyl-CoA synthetase
VNVADLLRHSADLHPSRTAIDSGSRQLTYAELDRLADRVVGMLAGRGMRQGDRVALMLPNGPEFPALYYGILRAGGIVVPMNPLLKSREIAYQLSDCAVRWAFVVEGPATAEATTAAEGTTATVLTVPTDRPGELLGEVLSEPVGGLAAVPASGPAEDDTAVILYTSGTTGTPKGAQLTHAGLVRNTQICAEQLFRLSCEDIVLGCLPLFHIFGQSCAMNAAISAGARLTLEPRFDAAHVLQTIEAQRVTVFAGVPTMYGALLAAAADGADRPRDTSSLRLALSGGAALPVEVLHGFEGAFGCPVLEGFGMSETSPVVSFNHPDRPRKAGSVGTPIEGVQMRLADVRDGVGELCVRGHNVMAGYWGRPEATAEAVVDGWLHTGDLARVDEDGYYYIVDRKKDMIIRGGYNVYPREIEEVLHEHHDIAEAAVIGVPHPALGEEIAAAVVLRPGATATEDDLREFVRARVAPYKYPREVWLLDSLAKGATGKILKRDITRPAGR